MTFHSTARTKNQRLHMFCYSWQHTTRAVGSFAFHQERWITLHLKQDPRIEQPTTGGLLSCPKTISSAATAVHQATIESNLKIFDINNSPGKGYSLYILCICVPSVFDWNIKSTLKTLISVLVAACIILKVIQ